VPRLPSMIIAFHPGNNGIRKKVTEIQIPHPLANETPA
jgi:hypothetical protein